MDTGYYKFYEKKFKLLLLLLGCVIFAIACYWAIIDEDIDAIRKFVLLLVMPFFGFGSIALLVRLLLNKVYIEITPTYIKIGNFEKCLWVDIVGVSTSYDKKSGFFLHVKDVSKYKLTFWQRVNLSHGSSPFYIALTAISDKDKKELKRILKEHIPQNNLD